MVIGPALLSISKSPSRLQALFTFSPWLVRAIRLDRFDWMALDHDPKKRTLTFHPCKQRNFRDGFAFKIGAYQKSGSRTISVRKSALTFLPAGKLRLTAKPETGKPFAIAY